MVDERNPTSSRTSKPDSSKTEKQVDSFVPPLDASKSDLSNPYFTHHSDHPGLVLISKPLNGDNYSAWHKVNTQNTEKSNFSVAMAVRSNQMKNNSAGNTRSDRSNRFYSDSQDS